MLQRRQNSLHHTIDILINLSIRDAKDEVATTLKNERPLYVAPQLLVGRMRRTVDLNDELPIKANEVGNKPVNRMLTPELPA